MEWRCNPCRKRLGESKGRHRDLNSFDPADKRRTLYWNPMVTTDENGEAIIECYNSSNTAAVSLNAAMLEKGVSGYINTTK